MQLDLDCNDEFEATHDSGVKFTLIPIDPRAYEKLQRQAGRGKNGEADPIAFAGLFAKQAIVRWEGVKQHCSDENKQRFGERFAFNVMPWLVSQCMDVARTIDAEVDAAKNG
ncbi:MAG: hypothetical protein Q8S32_17250 [Burkholderiaceae bacterium]|nr:hypothetical protein [Burkholderiaceae bacterium]